VAKKWKTVAKSANLLAKKIVSLERAMLGLFAALTGFEGSEIDHVRRSSDHGRELDIHNNLRAMKASILVMGCERWRRGANRPSYGNVIPLARCGVWVASLELGFIVTDAEFKAAKLARKLIADNIMRCMESMACMLFAIEMMIAEQIPGLTTRTR
jgi:hypothetical protein